MIVKKCPLCGNEPMAICYPSNPPLYGYTHCDIHGGYNKDWHEAELKWNEQVNTRTPKERGAEKPKITCLNCKHLMFSDMYGECNKQLRIVNPSDACEYAEPKERG